MSDNTALSVVKSFLDSPRVRLAVIVVFAALGMFGKLSDTELQPMGSAAHAAISREILKTGDWLTLHWPYSEEFSDFYQFPPLFFWLQAITFRIFGVSDWSAKLVSAFFGFLTIILTYFLARLVFNNNNKDKIINSSSGEEYAAFLAAMTIIFTPYFFRHSRKCELETILIFFIALGFLFFILSEKMNDPRWLIPAGLSCGLGLMSKGPPAMVLWAAVFVYYFIDGGNSFKKISNIYLWVGIAVTFVVPMLWILPQVIYKGNALYEKYFVNQIIWSLKGRSREAVSFIEKLKGYLFFFGAFSSYYLPWSITGICGVVKIIREKLKSYYILIIWAVVVWAGFTLAGYKDDYYLLAMWPSWAAINGFVFSRWTEKIKIPVTVSSALLASIFAAAVLFAPVKFDRARNPEFPKLGVLINSVVPEGGRVIVYKMFYYDAAALLPWYAMRGAVSMAKEDLPPDAKAWRLRSPETPEDLEKIFSSGDGVNKFILIKKTDYETLPLKIRKSISILREEGRFFFGIGKINKKRLSLL